MTALPADTSASLMPTYKRLDVEFVSGEGVWLFTRQGVPYLDALSGIAVCGLGHAHPAVTEAVAQQAGRLVHTSNLYRIPLQEELAQRLVALSAMHKVFFCNSGAEANEAAIKICRRYAVHKQIREPLILVMEGGFHGRTMGALSATGSSAAQAGFKPLLPGFLRIPYDDISALTLPDEVRARVVAVMLEPIQGEGGVVLPAPGYLRELRARCDRNGWLLALDEVQTGICRTGAWFACQHDEVLPDVLTLAKSLGNGLPVGACLAKGVAAQLLMPGTHGSTFGGNPLVAAAALAVIRVMGEDNLAGRAARSGAWMLEQLRAGLQDVDGVTAIRGKGLMIGIALSRDCPELVEQALEQRLLINVTAGNVVRLLPPLIIAEDEQRQIVDTVCRLVREFAAS